MQCRDCKLRKVLEFSPKRAVSSVAGKDKEQPSSKSTHIPNAAVVIQVKSAIMTFEDINEVIPGFRYSAGQETLGLPPPESTASTLKINFSTSSTQSDQWNSQDQSLPKVFTC